MQSPAPAAPFAVPSTHTGPITYALTGLIHVVESCGEMLARRSQRKLARHGEAPEAVSA